MQWSKASCAGNAPAARSSQSLTAHGDCMYVFGGECTPRIPLAAELFCYNNMQHTWQQLKVSGIDDLGPRLGHSMTAIGRDLYTFGGRTGIHFADSTLGDLYKIDIDTLICSEVRGSGTAPEPRSYHSAVSSGNNLYLFGGCGAKGRLNDLHQYDTKTNSWQTLPSQPGIKPRGGASLIAHEDKLFVIGGFCGKELGDVHMFDLTKQAWQAITGGKILPARSVFGCGILPQSCTENSQGASHDWIVVFGGEVGPSELGHEGAGDYADEVFGLDPNRPQLGWQKLSILGTTPSRRAWLASTSFGAGMALHGGSAPDNSRLQDMYFLSHGNMQ